MSSVFPTPSLFININTRTDSIFYIDYSKIPYYDMTFCIEGRMEYEFDGETVILESGDAFIFPPGCMRMRKHTTVPSYYVCFNVMFDFELNGPKRGIFRKCITREMVYILETINSTIKSASPMKTEKCFDLFMFLYHQTIEAVLDTDLSYVKMVKEYVEKHISEKISIGDISSTLHLTPNYLCNVFKKHTGETIFRHIISRRIELAKMLIITKHYPLGTVCEMCGFKDYNYFSHTFKSIEGVTPSSFKKAGISI